MLNALRNRIFSNKKKKKSFEEVVDPFHSQEPSPVDFRNIRFVTCGEEGWENYNYLNEILPKNDTTKDLSRYNYTPVTGEIPEKVKKEVGKLYNHIIKSIDIEESKDKYNCIIPTLKILPKKNDKINVRDLLENDICKEYDFSAVNICHEDGTRGLRLIICEDADGNECRLYRVISQTYDMDLNWFVEGKECKMKISISDDGSVKILQRNGVTDEEIRAHQCVFLGGKELEPRLLSEALGLQKSQAKSSEPISPECKADETQSKSVIDKKIQCPYPTTGFMSMSPQEYAPEFYNTDVAQESTTLIKDFVEKNHEAKSALKDFASEVKEESSESFKSFTDMIKGNIKKADSSIGH